MQKRCGCVNLYIIIGFPTFISGCFLICSPTCIFVVAEQINRRPSGVAVAIPSSASEVWVRFPQLKSVCVMIMNVFRCMSVN